jgi:hypothetical protein
VARGELAKIATRHRVKSGSLLCVEGWSSGPDDVEWAQQGGDVDAWIAVEYE